MHNGVEEWEENNPLVYERCYCGAEQVWQLRASRRMAVDVAWFKAESARLGEGLPDYVEG